MYNAFFAAYLKRPLNGFPKDYGRTVITVIYYGCELDFETENFAKKKKITFKEAVTKSVHFVTILKGGWTF